MKDKQKKCYECGAIDSIRYDKRCVSIDDINGSYRDLSFYYCEQCGDVTNVDFS